MKKQIFTLGLMLAAAFTLTNCDKISDNEQFAKNDFTIFATPSVETKTSNDGMATNWNKNDSVAVYHALAGSTSYVNDGKFVIAQSDLATGRFTGELGQSIDASKSYDWYIIYPYESHKTAPNNNGKGYLYIGCGANKYQEQVGNDNMGHICGIDVPLYAVAKNLSGTDTPSVSMHHMSAAIEFNLTNNSGSDMTVASIEFTSTEPIQGSFYMDITGDKPVFEGSGDSYVSNTAKVSVKNGSAIKNGKSAKFYLVMKPHSVNKGAKLSVKVKASDGTIFTKEITTTSAATFEAGKIHTINVSYVPSEGGGSTGGGDGVFDSSISWTLGANAYDQKANINGEEVAHILKLGTSSKVGTATLTIPAGVKKIGFYAIGWKGTNPTLTVGDKSMAINGNDGATGNPTYTITVTDNDYHEVDVSSGSVEVTCDGRVLIFGINAK